METPTEGTPTLTGEDFQKMARETLAARRGEELAQKEMREKLNPAQRRDYTIEEKRALVGQFKKSGMTTEEGWKSLGLSGPTLLRRWLKDHRVVGGKVVVKQEKKPKDGRSKLRALAPEHEHQYPAAVKLLKQGVSAYHVAKQMKLHKSTVGRWKTRMEKEAKGVGMAAKRAAVDKLVSKSAKNLGKPLQRPYYPPTQYSDAEKRQAVKLAQSGEMSLRDVAKKWKVHEASIRNWHKVFGTKPLPNGWDVLRKLRGDTSKEKKTDNTKRHFTIDMKRAAVARVQAGETQRAVAADIGVRSGVLSYWVAGRGMGHTRAVATVPATSLEVVATVSEAGEVTRISQHDAIVFLRLARDEGNKRIQSGKAKIDDPIILYAMLALHSLGAK